MTPSWAVRWCVNRMLSARDLTEPQIRWSSLAYAYQREPEVQAAKDRRKGDFA